jgi:ABC-type uncharacterized transport system permease subunit
MAMVSRAVQAVIVTGIFTSLGTFFVGLRLYTRIVITRAPGWEDAILVLSWVCSNWHNIPLAAASTYVHISFSL